MIIMDFNNFRFDYYLAGRELLFSKAAHGKISDMLLGYAIEACLKQGLIELEISGVRLDKKTINERNSKHNIPILFNYCQNYGIFQDIKVSKEFLDVVNRNLKCRYPSHQKKIFEDANRIDPFLFSLNIGTVIQYYDDLYCKLDDSLCAFHGDDRKSSIFKAAYQVGSATGRIFFHSNAPALSRLSKYAKMVKNEKSENDSDVIALNKGVDFLWSYNDLQIYGKINEILDCKDFRYQTFEESVEYCDDGSMIVHYFSARLIDKKDEILKNVPKPSLLKKT